MEGTGEKVTRDSIPPRADADSQRELRRRRRYEDRLPHDARYNETTSKREEYAKAFLAAMISSCKDWDLASDDEHRWARQALRFADALIEESLVERAHSDPVVQPESVIADGASFPPNQGHCKYDNFFCDGKPCKCLYHYVAQKEPVEKSVGKVIDPALVEALKERKRLDPDAPDAIVIGEAQPILERCPPISAEPVRRFLAARSSLGGWVVDELVPLPAPKEGAVPEISIKALSISSGRGETIEAALLDAGAPLTSVIVHIVGSAA